MARLIDTSVVIELDRRGHPAAAVLELAPGQIVAASSVTAAELLLGLERSGSPVGRRRRAIFVEGLLALLPILPFDLTSARMHAQIRAQMLISGRSIPAHDLLIASTALSNGYDLITLDRRHFERVPGLVIHQPDW